MLWVLIRTVLHSYRLSGKTKIPTIIVRNCGFIILSASLRFSLQTNLASAGERDKAKSSSSTAYCTHSPFEVSSATRFFQLDLPVVPWLRTQQSYFARLLHLACYFCVVCRLHNTWPKVCMPPLLHTQHEPKLAVSGTHWRSTERRSDRPLNLNVEHHPAPLPFRTG